MATERVRVEALVNIPGSMAGIEGAPARRIERGEKVEVTQEQADRLTELGYAEEIGPANENAAEDDTTELEELTVDVLEDRARDLGLTGYSDMRKAALIEAIRDAEE